MKMYKPKTWQYELTGTAGNVELFGIKIFDLPWESAGKRAEVRHPSGEMGSYQVKRIKVRDDSYEFIALRLVMACGSFIPINIKGGAL